jgi:hypothetical protein
MERRHCHNGRRLLAFVAATNDEASVVCLGRMYVSTAGLTSAGNLAWGVNYKAIGTLGQPAVILLDKIYFDPVQTRE